MELKDYLTTEPLKKKRKSLFELVNHAILVAQNMVHSGRDTYATTEVQNRAYQVLQEILSNRDRIVDLDKEQEEEEEKTPLTTKPKVIETVEEVLSDLNTEIGTAVPVE